MGALSLPVDDLRDARPGDRVQISLRAEDLRLHRRPPETRDVALRGRVLVRTFMGAVTRLDVACGELSCRVDVPSADAGGIAGGQEVWLTLAAPARVIKVEGGGAP